MANGTEVMDRPALPDVAVILLRHSRRGSNGASQRCGILKSIPVSLIYERAASKFGLTRCAHLSPSLQKCTDVPLPSYFPLFPPLFALRGL